MPCGLGALHNININDLFLFSHGEKMTWGILENGMPTGVSILFSKMPHGFFLSVSMCVHIHNPKNICRGFSVTQQPPILV
jgi:hypothetical protein